MRTESDHALDYWLGMAGRSAAAEARRGRNLHGPHHSYHEAWAVLHEEHDELWEEIKRRTPDHAAIEKEALQVAAMALRIAAMAQREKVCQ